MKVQKYEISRTIDKLKSIVQKNDQFPALGGVLVKDGYLIASNTEMTMQLKLEGKLSGRQTTKLCSNQNDCHISKDSVRFH